MGQRDPLPPNVADVLRAASALPATVPGIAAIALVGSWARGTGRHNTSDVDLVVLTRTPGDMLADTSWFAAFGDAIELVRSKDFGLLQERRLRRPDGLEIEVCIGDVDWARTDPLDAGTERVARDGLRPLFDPDGVLAVLQPGRGVANHIAAAYRRHRQHSEAGLRAVVAGLIVHVVLAETGWMPASYRWPVAIAVMCVVFDLLALLDVHAKSVVAT